MLYCIWLVGYWFFVAGETGFSGRSIGRLCFIGYVQRSCCVLYGHFVFRSAIRVFLLCWYNLFFHRSSRVEWAKWFMDVISLWSPSFSRLRIGVFSTRTSPFVVLVLMFLCHQYDRCFILTMLVASSKFVLFFFIAQLILLKCWMQQRICW